MGQQPHLMITTTKISEALELEVIYVNFCHSLYSSYIKSLQMLQF